MQGNEENIERLYLLIGKELDGSITDLEKSELAALLNNSEKHKKIYKQTTKLWNQPLTHDMENSTVDNFEIEVNADEAWNHLNDKILLSKIDENHAKMESEVIEKDKIADEQEAKKLKKTSTPEPKPEPKEKDNVVQLDPEKRKLPLSFGRTAKYGLAATVVFGLVLLLFFKDDLTNSKGYMLSKSAGPGETNSVQLSDKTQIQLQENSNLRYPEKFEGATREVDLKGVAFFDVARDESKPFIIHSGAVDVRVLGTSFQVSNVANQQVEVQVVSGTVKVESVENPELNVTLEKGEAARFNKEKSSFEQESTRANELFWTTKTIVFDNTEIEEVAKVLAECYQSKITFVNDTPKACRLTVTFQNQSLEEVMVIIANTLPDLKIDPDESNGGYKISSESGCK